MRWGERAGREREREGGRERERGREQLLSLDKSFRVWVGVGLEPTVLTYGKLRPEVPIVSVLNLSSCLKLRTVAVVR